MEIWQSIVLGAVQGLTEFLPVSSSGHLLLLNNWFGVNAETSVFYTIMLHIGTLIPVLLVLWNDILGLFANRGRRFWLLVLATIPAGVLGIVFHFLGAEEFFAQHIWILSIAFLFTAGEMIFSEIYSKKVEMSGGITAKSAFIMGCGQAVGVVSGISRSGSTITAGCLAKVDRKENANFTFLMSIPIIIAAFALESVSVATGKKSFGPIEWLPLIFGVVTAMITGYIAIKVMLSLIKKANYKWFALYLVLLSAANLIVCFVR